MAAVTVRGIPDEVHRALKGRAAAHGRSTEAEIREILRIAVAGPAGSELGDRLAAIGQRHGGFDLEIVRDGSHPEPADFS
jgi:plasmid stability protein